MKLSFIISRISLVLLVLSYSISIQGQHLTISTSGEGSTGNVTSGTNWSINTFTHTLTVTGTLTSANIHPNVITSYLANAGSLTVILPWQGINANSPRFIYINNNITYSGNRTATLQFFSGNSIVIASGISIESTSFPMHLALNTRYNVDYTVNGGLPDYGNIAFTNNTITTMGGNFWVGGGGMSNTLVQFANSLWVGDGPAITWAHGETGLRISGTTITTGGGHVSMNGWAFPSGTAGLESYGLSMSNSTINTGTGNITLTGQINGTYTNGIGLALWPDASGPVNLTTTSGNITLTGSGYDVNPPATNYGTGWRNGLILEGGSNSITISSQSGNITLEGTAAFNSTSLDREGLHLFSNVSDRVRILSRSGSISLKGSNTREAQGQYCNGMIFRAGNVSNAIRIGTDGTNSYTGNILIESNSILQNTKNAGSGSLAIQTTGTLTIRPKDNSFTYLRADPANTLTFDDDWNFGSTLGGFTFGKNTNTLSLTYDRPLTTTGPITFHTGDFTPNGAINSAGSITFNTANFNFKENITSSTASDITINSTADFIAPASRKTISSAGGDIIVHADKDANGSGVLNLGFVTLDPGAGDIIVRGKNFNWSIAQPTDEPYLNGTGSITIEPSDAAFGQEIQLAWLQIDKDNNGMAGLTIGKLGNNQNITQNFGPLSVAGPVNFYGGNIYINESINTTAGAASGDVLLKASGDIVLGSGKSITTNGGDVILWANSDGGTTNGGVFLDQSSSIATVGGHIWIGGGSGSTTWNGLTVGNGYAVSGRNLENDFAVRGAAKINWDAGVLLDETSLNSGGGNIYIAGQRNARNNHDGGAGIINYSGTAGTTINAGTGTIEIAASGNYSGHLTFGFMTGLHPTQVTGGLTITSANTNSTATNALQITVSTLWTQNAGLAAEGNTQFLSTAATNGGGISITASSAQGTGWGTWVQTGSLNVLSASGAISLNAGNSGLGLHPTINGTGTGFLYLGSKAGTSVTSSTANMILTADRIVTNTGSSINAASSGTLTVESAAASFSQTVSNSQWVLGTGLTGLRIGKESNTAAITIGSALTIAGPISIYGGDIDINENINTTTGGGAGDILLKSSANIVLAGSKSLTTTGGDVILWANSDGATTNGGAFFKASSSITTGGGHIWIGGGSTNTTWNGLTVGNGFAVSGRNPIDLGYIGGLNDWYAGIAFIQTTLSSGGGNIYIAGQRNSNSPVNVGAGFINNSGTGTLIDAGNGTVTLKGSNTAAGDGAFGIMTGLHPNGYTGRFTVKSSNSTATNAITVDGTSSAGTGDGILIENHARFLSTASTNGGGIAISGTAVGNRNALSVGIGSNSGTLDVLSASGAININVGIYPLLVASQGNMKLGSIQNDADIGSSTANVVITSNNVSWTGSVPIRTSGTLIVTPTTGSSFAATLNSSALNYTGIRGLVLGNATNTAGITIGTSTSIAGPITCYGGDININENINTTAGAASGDILLKASGNIFTAANKSITTNNGDVILWADSDNTGNGSISLGNNTTINTANELTTSGLSGGGKVVLAGGNDDGSNGGAASDGIPDGFAASSTGNGISLGTSTANTTLMYSGGGDIIIRGKSTYASGTTFTDRIGMFQYGKWTANAGKGSIIITGTATGFYGVNFTYPASNLTSTDKHLVLISDKATGDAIKITGTSNNDYGVVFNYLNPKEILATGGGNISITGTAGGNYGVFLQNQDILATGGTITLDGGSRGILSTQYGARFGARSGTTITTSSANVVLAGDVLAFDNLASGFTNTVTTAGTLAVQPSTISFASALAWPIPRFTVGSGITGMTLGKSTNVSNVTISSSQSIAGPITIYGGTITLNQNISSSTGGLISLLGNTVALGFPITLVNGDILLGSSTVVNGTPTNYFKTTGTGTVKRSVANGSSFTYPVGNSSYNPVTITNNTNESDDFSVRVADQVLANGTTGTAITDKVVNRTWHIGKTNANASPGINFTFQWNANEELGTLSDYKLSHFGNSAWALAAGTSGPVSGTTTKTMAHTGYTGTFSPFAIGSTSSVLPVSWLNFTGKKVTQGVELNWSTSSEQNTKDFQVQHSINAQQWTSVGNLPAAGNSNTVRNYRFVHEGPFKNSIQHYYRILQRDLDGKFSYSKVIRIEYLDGATDVVLYPNPASDVLHINITERQELRLVNIQGVVVWKGVLPAGRHEIPVSNFATGNYILQAGKGIYRVVIQ